MSALHEAVARAIASAPMTDNLGAAVDDFDAMAAVAIRVCMSEAQQAVEELQERPLGSLHHATLADALAVLAALAGEHA